MIIRTNVNILRETSVVKPTEAPSVIETKDEEVVVKPVTRKAVNNKKRKAVPASQPLIVNEEKETEDEEVIALSEDKIINE